MTIPTDVEGEAYQKICDDALAKLMLAGDDFNEAFVHYCDATKGMHWTDRAGIWTSRPSGKLPQVVLTTWTRGMPVQIYPEDA